MMRNLTQYTSIPDGEPKWRFYIDPTVNANLLLMTNYSSVGPSCTPLFVADSRFTNVDYCAFHENLYSVSVLWNPNAVSAAERQSCFLMRPGRWLPGGVAAAAGRYSVPYLFEYTDPVAGIGYVHSVLAMVSADNVLLMRAEANVLKENYAAAMEDINRWVKMRMTAQWASPKTENQLVEYYGGLPYYTSTAPTVKKRMTPETPFTSDRQEAFIHAILHLRRIEFIFEGSRWFDIKRYNIEITRRKVKETDYTTLDPDSVEEIDKLGVRDLRMAIQLPEGPISRGMTPNPR
jgi:hypothetical protein